MPKRKPKSVLQSQHGGSHYKKLGHFQPWKVLHAWLSPEEFRGYMKGTAVAYLAREQSKGGNLDIDKAVHTLQALRELQPRFQPVAARRGQKPETPRQPNPTGDLPNDQD